MNVDAKVLNEILQAGSRRTLNISDIMIKWHLFQECKDGSLPANDEISYTT